MFGRLGFECYSAVAVAGIAAGTAAAAAVADGRTAGRFHVGKAKCTGSAEHNRYPAGSGAVVQVELTRVASEVTAVADVPWVELWFVNCSYSPMVSPGHPSHLS